MEENQCPEMSTKWFTFETTWNIKDNFHVECIDWPSIFKPILPDCCHTLTVTHPECEKVTGDICGTYKYDSDSLNHSPIYNKDCNDVTLAMCKNMTDVFREECAETCKVCGSGRIKY